MKKPLILLSILLLIGALGLFVLAGTLNFGNGWTIGWVIFSVTVVVALVIAFLEFIDGKEGDNIVFLPKASDISYTKGRVDQRKEVNSRRVSEPVVARCDLPGLTSMRSWYSAMKPFDEQAVLAGQEIGT